MDTLYTEDSINRKVELPKQKVLPAGRSQYKSIVNAHASSMRILTYVSGTLNRAGAVSSLLLLPLFEKALCSFRYRSSYKYTTRSVLILISAFQPQATACSQPQLKKSNIDFSVDDKAQMDSALETINAEAANIQNILNIHSDQLPKSATSDHSGRGVKERILRRSFTQM
jgi:hypothetical protein